MIILKRPFANDKAMGRQILTFHFGQAAGPSYNYLQKGHLHAVFQTKHAVSGGHQT
jgi:hypothetical protein